MNKICGIYKITSPTGKIYIGQSRDINRRISEYKNTHAKNQHILHNSIIKYGWVNHVFKILIECDVEKLNELEIHYVNEFDVYNTKHGMNLTSGGDCHFKISEESRKRMSDAKKGTKLWLGKKHTKESKKKMSLSRMGNKNMLGKKHTEESKKKMSKSKKGSIVSPKTRLAISRANIGKKHSEETKKKISIANTGKKRGELSEEHKEKIRIANTGKKRSKESCERIRISNTGRKHSEETKKKISINSKNRAGNYEIYDSNNVLISKFHSNIRHQLKKLGLPRERFQNSFKSGEKIKNQPYMNWYVIKL